jgi:NADH-quinone oxidoreductase subunit F
VGTVRQDESLIRLRTTADRDAELTLLADLDTVMRDSSICGLGQFATVAVQSAIQIGLIGAEA